MKCHYGAWHEFLFILIKSWFSLRAEDMQETGFWLPDFMSHFSLLHFWMNSLGRREESADICTVSGRNVLETKTELDHQMVFTKDLTQRLKKKGERIMAKIIKKH